MLFMHHFDDKWLNDMYQAHRTYWQFVVVRIGSARQTVEMTITFSNHAMLIVERAESGSALDEFDPWRQIYP